MTMDIGDVIDLQRKMVTTLLSKGFIDPAFAYAIRYNIVSTLPQEDYICYKTGKFSCHVHAFHACTYIIEAHFLPHGQPTPS